MTASTDCYDSITTELFKVISATLCSIKHLAHVLLLQWSNEDDEWDQITFNWFYKPTCKQSQGFRSGIYTHQFIMKYANHYKKKKQTGKDWIRNVTFLNITAKEQWFKAARGHFWCNKNIRLEAGSTFSDHTAALHWVLLILSEACLQLKWMNYWGFCKGRARNCRFFLISANSLQFQNVLHLQILCFLHVKALRRSRPDNPACCRRRKGLILD